MRLQFLGATGTVTGSKFLLSNHDERVLIDCGLYQGYKNLRLRNWQGLPCDPAHLNGVVLTHAHIDHSGYLPVLVKNGFKRDIFATEATVRLCQILLPDAGYLQEEDADYANRKGTSRHHPALPLFTEKDARETLHYFRPMPFCEKKVITPDIGFEMHPAGHILGAAIIRFNLNGRTLTFTGDLGRASSDLLPRPAQFEDTDTLVIESTYGNRSHPAEDPIEIMGAIIKRTVARGGSVLIPAFAIGRTQLVLQIIHNLRQRGVIGDVPVYMDSPMAIEATRVFKEEGEFHRLSDSEFAAILGKIGIARTAEESRQLGKSNRPVIIVSASGMATGGRVVHHLKRMLPDPQNTIIFAGFQAAGTRGEALINGATEVKIHGQWIKAQAEITRLDSLSAHADSDGLLEWMRGFRKAPRQIFIVHGEPAAAEGLRQRIDRELGWRAEIPEYLMEYEL